jgi:hypothetical protein
MVCIRRPYITDSFFSCLSRHHRSHLKATDRSPHWDQESHSLLHAARSVACWVGWSLLSHPQSSSDSESEKAKVYYQATTTAAKRERRMRFGVDISEFPLGHRWIPLCGSRIENMRRRECFCPWSLDSGERRHAWDRFKASFAWRCRSWKGYLMRDKADQGSCIPSPKRIKFYNGLTES